LSVEVQFEPEAENIIPGGNLSHRSPQTRGQVAEKEETERMADTEDKEVLCITE
jgi:hypothetical protein